MSKKTVVPSEEKRLKNETNLRKIANTTVIETYSQMQTTEKGLNSLEVAKRLEEKGKNLIVLAKQETPLTRLISAFINPFSIVLFIVAIITFITDITVPGQKNFTTVIIILVLIIISSLISYIQGEKSNKAAEKLSNLIVNKVDTIRAGVEQEADMPEIVVGDIIKLGAGDIIPADVRFIFAKDAFIAQATLTGESQPAEKFSTLVDTPIDSITDLSNIGFMGTNMTSGTAKAVVIATGNDTYIASMARGITGGKSKNSFEKGVSSVSNLLLRLMVIMVPLIFVINGVTKGDWGSALLFAVSMAVGLTPEMLPMIMTATLAKGAVVMSKENTIVKNPSSIQSFGEMDILCTDKTGTLTEDKIVLEKYIDINGKDDDQVLKMAYLNSSFQTGLRNLMDVAVITTGNTDGLKTLQGEYTVVDEIPFDFLRRKMSVVLKQNNDNKIMITKGAVEEMFAICSLVSVNGTVTVFDDQQSAAAMEVYNHYNQQGIRVVAVAQKTDLQNNEVFGVEDEKELTLLGFIGFLDPPKESAISAVAALKEHGVRTVILTGDSAGVAATVCKQVGINTEKILVGKDIDALTNEQLLGTVDSCDLYAKLSPEQKRRIVEAFQTIGHTVGYMGDGINDAPALHQSDVGISVDTAVDIAKESANIILLKKDLMVLKQGVIQGRRTFGNVNKYIKMAVSGNFGNMFSVIIASVFLPFLPMLPLQLLVQNLLCDFSQGGIPFDNVDDEYTKKPKKWDAKSIKRFMLIMGSVSSLFDIICFAILWWVFGANTKEMAPLFQCGWFVFGTVSQILVIHMIRTQKIPFIQSRASLPLMVSTLSIAVIALIIGFSPLATWLNMTVLPFSFFMWLVLLIVGYCLVIQLVKRIYIHKFKEWL